MHLLIVRPTFQPKPEKQQRNRALFERYMPDFMEFFMEARQELDATLIGEIEFKIPDGDIEFVQSNMDDTKRLFAM